MAVVAVAIGLACPGCGGDDTFDAPGFAAAANEHGAGLSLGSELTTTDENKSVYGVSLEEPAGEDAGGPTVDLHAHGGGSLIVTDDDAAALAEHQRCEQTGLLICFRAANVAIALEGEADPDQVARLRQAVAELGDG